MEYVQALERRRLLSHTPVALDYEQYLIELINRARANQVVSSALEAMGTANEIRRAASNSVEPQ